MPTITRSPKIPLGMGAPGKSRGRRVLLYQQGVGRELGCRTAKTGGLCLMQATKFSRTKGMFWLEQILMPLERSCSSVLGIHFAQESLVLPGTNISEAQDGLQHLQSFWLWLITASASLPSALLLRSIPGSPELLERQSPPGAGMSKSPWHPRASAHAHRAAWAPLWSPHTVL